jgi:hypothetical protein
MLTQVSVVYGIGDGWLCCKGLRTLISTDKGFEGFESFNHIFWRLQPSQQASLTGHVYRISHKQLLNVSRPIINTMKATAIQTICPSAGVGLSSSSFMSSPR